MSALRLAWGSVWCAPLHILALLLMPFYWPTSMVARSGKLEIRVKRCMAPGQTWGLITFYTSEPSADLRLHEDRHTLQALIFGPLMLVLYPLGALWGLLCGNYHDANPFEVDAWRVSGVR